MAAGSGGFQIHVGGTTTLAGAALASTADPSKNLLDTGNLVIASLHNTAESSASQMGLSYSSSGSWSSNLLSNGVGAALNMAVPQGDNQSSDTRSRIAQGSIVIRNHPNQDVSGIDRDATTLDGQGVANDFDLEQIKENQELGQAAGYVGMRAAGDIAQLERDKAKADYKDALTRGDAAGMADAMARVHEWGERCLHNDSAWHGRCRNRFTGRWRCLAGSARCGGQ